MATKKKTTAGRTLRKHPSKVQTRQRSEDDSAEAAWEYLRPLALAQSYWGSYYASIPRHLKEQRAHALAVRRIVKAAFDAFATADNETLANLEKQAKHALRRTQQRHLERTGAEMADLSAFEPSGWIHPLGDVVHEKGDAQGRALTVEVALNTLEYRLSNGLDADGFATWMFMRVSSPSTDFTDLLPDLRVIESWFPNNPSLRSDHPQAVAMAATRKAFARWERSRARDPETLLKAGFRAFGMSKDGAANLLKFRDKRATRGAKE
ncbi:MAG TPA: hypothetical protein VJV79_15800 [Polyangiaceae bacterium]|nr:hypothetical protein [Polyangiaceae bacterium]